MAPGRSPNTNALGHTTRVDFDAVNQPRREHMLPALRRRASNGNILNATDARNGVTRFVYDDMDRVSTARDPLLHDDVYEYDANGNSLYTAQTK